jgi:hypothetical protein
VLNSFRIKQKLFAITRDNASNNSTLYSHLHRKLKREFNNEITVNSSKPLINFHSENSYICYLAHIINLIYKAILKEVKASTYKEAKAILNAMLNSNIESSKVFHEVDTQTAIIKLHLLIMWILKSTRRINMFAEFYKLKLNYNVDT